MVQFLIIGPFFNDLWILEIYEIYGVNSMISDYLIEQKFTIPVLINIFNFFCCILLLKIVPKWSHKVEIYFISENWKKRRDLFWRKYARILDISEYDQKIQNIWKSEYIFFTQIKWNYCSMHPVTTLTTYLESKYQK